MATYMDKGNTGPAPLPSPYKPNTPSTTLFGQRVVMSPAPTPARVPSVSNSGTVSSGGGGYTGYSSGGGGGGGYTPAPAAAVTPPPPMSINDWLNQDDTYQAQTAALKKALSDYISQQGVAKNQYNVDYAARTNDLGIQKTRGLEDQANDFASRGMYFSGLYGRDLSNLVGDFARRQTDMDTARANYLANQATDLSNFQDQQGLTATKAKQDAIARRAAQYGI